MRPFRFLTGADDIVDGPTLIHQARRAEATGYSGVAVSDHLLAQLSPLPVLGMIAGATDRLRLGTFVLNNDLRHPAVLAAELATLDLLSGGRLEVGLGAGWNGAEYAMTGIAFEPVGTRIGRLEEAVAVLKGLFGEGLFSLAGQHYRITATDGQPKPVQQPHPPLMIGGLDRFPRREDPWAARATRDQLLPSRRPGHVRDGTGRGAAGRHVADAPTRTIMPRA